MQTSALTTRQRADAFLLVAAVEVKTSAIRAAGHFELTHRQDIESARNVFPHGFVVRQIIARLVYKRHLNGLANLDLTAVRLLLTRNHAKQSRLTGTVRTDDADDRPWRHFEAQVVDQHAVAKGLGDVSELDHLLA